MPTVRVPLSGGRVTSRDQSALMGGELSKAQDAYYKPYNPGIWKIPGRTAFNSSPESSPIRGVAWLDFDTTVNDLLVIMRGTAYRKASAAALTGTFSDLAGFDASNYALSGTATTLDTVHFNNQQILLNGVDRNRVVSDTGTQMFHSMLAAVSPPDIANNGAGAGFTLTSQATILYWIEERVKSGNTIIKRSASLSAQVATLTGTGISVKPRINRPAVVNPDATHWAVFASALSGSFPAGAELGEATIATAFIDDTRTGTDPGLPGGTAYGTITAIIANTTFIVPKYGPAPIASTGDIFEDSLLTNDITDTRAVVFSIDGDIHSVPSLNKFRIGDTKRRDSVVAIRSLDTSCVILGRDGVYKIATLPRPGDSTFSPERVKSRIHYAQGCVSPNAAEVFSFGQGLRLAYVSRYGILVTDGSEWDAITDDVDWESEVDISQASKFVLANNFRQYRLELFYIDLNGNRRCMFLHYHPSHAKPTESGSVRAKMTWPIRRDANAACTANIGNIDYIISANDDGKLYVHDNGNSEPVIQGGIQFIVETGEFYPEEAGNEVRIRNLHVRHQAHPGQTADFYHTEFNPGEPPFEVRVPGIDLSFRESTPTFSEGITEGAIFGVSNSDTLGSICLDYYTVMVDPSGTTKEP